MMVTPMIVGRISKMYSDISSGSYSYEKGDFSLPCEIL